MKTILLCSDLDRTLIPNGAQPESPQARPALFRLAAHSGLRLAYVSGRDRNLVREAITEFHLPQPDFVIGDVGATLYRVEGQQWRMSQAWWRDIGRDWHGLAHDDIQALLAEVKDVELQLQPPEKQNKYKISYYTDPSVDAGKFREKIAGILEDHGVAANIIWSRDEAEQRGLLDILPRRANKLLAIRFLMDTEEMAEYRTVFAGDSGNDLDVLTSGLQSILVNNAAEDVRKTATERLSEQGYSSGRLYLAKGGFQGMNGNYAAGVLEGLVHFFPETAGWVTSAVNTPG